jgi:hypothetical protein
MRHVASYSRDPTRTGERKRGGDWKGQGRGRIMRVDDELNMIKQVKLNVQTSAHN